MGLKMFGSGVEDLAQNEEFVESSEEIASQVFPDHEEQTERLLKTLYYGKLPVSDRPSLPLTKFAVDQFTNVGLDGLKLGRLDVGRAAEITRAACVCPSSLVLALLYLDRLRKRNPEYLTTISSADLFLVSMMVASKFLHDDGEQDEVFNDEWAQSGGMDTKEINKLEIEFLSAIDWKIFVNTEDFKKSMTSVEQDIAMKEVSDRGWVTYTELAVLSQHPGVAEMWTLCLDMGMRLASVCLAAYAAGLLSLLATVSLLEKSSLGPSAVTNSVNILRNLTPDQDLLPVDDDLDEVLSQHRVTTADILTASLLVTSLSSGIQTKENSVDFDNFNNSYEDTDNNPNYTRSLWLSEQSYRDAGAGDNFVYGVRKWKTSTTFDLDFDRDAVDWKKLLLKDLSVGEGVSSYLGRCPVLRWGSSWIGHDGRHLWSKPISLIPMNV